MLLCLADPQRYFGVPSNSHIHLLNVASSAPQAHAAFFKPLRAMVVESPWFKDKFESGEPPGEMASSVRFVRHIELVSGHSDADNLEGKNLIAAIADEISAFPTLAQSGGRGVLPAKTADGLIDMLRTSATTRFEQTYKLAQISFPRQKGDAIEQALVEAKASEAKYGEKSTKYASGPHATWDVNPRFNKYDRIPMPTSHFGTIPNVPSYVEQYETNPIKARAKYECAPERSANPYFKDKASVHRAFSDVLPVPPLKIEYFFGTDVAAGETVPSWQVRFEWQGPRPNPGALYAIHADMAITGDRAGLAMSHVKEWREVLTGGSADGTEASLERRPLVVTDFVHAFEADASAQTESGEAVPREVQIRWFRKLVLFLLDCGFRILRVSMDGFQSADSLQILQARGLDAVKVSVDRTEECWKSMRDVMYDGRLAGPHHPLLISELEGLTKVNNGKVDHSALGSKDLADAVAASIAGALALGGQEDAVSTMPDFHESDGFSVPARLSDGLPDTFNDSGFSFSGAGFGANVFGREGDLQW